MSHDLYMRDGRAAMMYVKEKPWHGLGTMLEKPPTSREAIEAAQLDWEVAKFPLHVRFGREDEFFRKVDRVALMPVDRIDSPKCPVFGVVGENYGIVQNVDAFSFFDPLIESGQAFYETAGALGEGERIWVLARLPATMVIGKSDLIEKYLLLMNSHTGTSTVQIKLTPVRVVCQNTLNMALQDGESIKIPHTPDVKKRLDEAGRLIQGIMKRYAKAEELFQRMAQIHFSIQDFQRYLDSFMPEPVEVADESAQKTAWRERIVAQRKLMQEFYKNGNDQDPPDIRGTLWSAYNTITYFSDYVLAQPAEIYTSDVNSIKNWSRENLEKRLKRLWLGDAATLKAKAFDIATTKFLS